MNRIKQFTYSRANYEEELEWSRVEDFVGHSLPRPLVLVNGSFDLLHSGHMKVIATARKKAKTLVCAMDSDELVRKQKGLGRPILSWIERAAAMNYMPIDYLVEIESPREFNHLVSVLKPDLRVQGADYVNVPSRHPSVPKLFVRDGGMRTSEIIRRINDRDK
jgi:cytidyltransferase-like protein